MPELNGQGSWEEKMAACSSVKNLQTPFKSSGRKPRKSLSFSCSKFSSRKWKSNNLHLAQENARLRKDVQKWIQLHTEDIVRYNILEMSWRRRGETLSRISIMSHAVGNQIQKLVDSITEIESVCQKELSAPAEGIANNSEKIFCCRHSMPNMNLGRLSSSCKASPVCPRSQLIHRVKPMVRGHLIIKPTITLQRLNLQDIPTRNPVEQMQSPLPESDEDQTEEVDLTRIAENATDSSPASSDEEDCVQIPLIPSRKKMQPSSSAVTSNDLILPVAMVLLERMSLPKKLEEKSICHQMVMENDTSVLIDESMSTTSQHSPVLSLSEHSKEVSEICSNVTPADTILNKNVQSRSKNTETVVGKKSVSSNGRSNNFSVRKYPPSSRSKTPTSSELWKSRTNGISEKCQLVVALKDIGNCLRNGVFTSTEKLGEERLKINAVVQPESKEKSIQGRGEDVELSILDTSIENQTQLNFTAGIGTLNYTTIPKDIGDSDGKDLTPKEEFLKRIQTEDPLEGTSWHFKSRVNVRGKKRRSKTLPGLQSTTNANSGNKWPFSYTTPKKLNSDRSQHEPTQNDYQDPSAETTPVDCDEDMDITECIPFTIVTGINSRSEMGKEADSSSVNESVLGKKQPEASAVWPTKEVAALPHKRKPRKLYIIDSDESVLDEEWKPKKNRRKNSQHTKARSAKIKRKNVPRSIESGSVTVLEESTIMREQSVERRVSSDVFQSESTSPQLEFVNNGIDEANVNDLHVRVKRRAAPSSLKEASLVRKMRRDTH